MSNTSKSTETVGSDLLTGAVILASALLLASALVIPAVANSSPVLTAPAAAQTSSPVELS